jgi:hypothetical protein
LATELPPPVDAIALPESAPAARVGELLARWG